MSTESSSQRPLGSAVEPCPKTATITARWSKSEVVPNHNKNWPPKRPPRDDIPEDAIVRMIVETTNVPDGTSATIAIYHCVTDALVYQSTLTNLEVRGGKVLDRETEKEPEWYFEAVHDPWVVWDRPFYYFKAQVDYQGLEAETPKDYEGETAACLRVLYWDMFLADGAVDVGNGGDLQAIGVAGHVRSFVEGTPHHRTLLHGGSGGPNPMTQQEQAMMSNAPAMELQRGSDHAWFKTEEDLLLEDKADEWRGGLGEGSASQMTPEEHREVWCASCAPSRDYAWDDMTPEDKAAIRSSFDGMSWEEMNASEKGACMRWMSPEERDARWGEMNATEQAEAWVQLPQDQKEARWDELTTDQKVHAYKKMYSGDRSHWAEKMTEEETDALFEEESRYEHIQGLKGDPAFNDKHWGSVVRNTYIFDTHGHGYADDDDRQGLFEYGHPLRACTAITAFDIHSVTSTPSAPYALAYINHCLVGKYPDVANAFLARGTKHVIAYRLPVYEVFASEMAEEFFSLWKQSSFDPAAVPECFLAVAACQLAEPILYSQGGVVEPSRTMEVSGPGRA